MVWLMSGEDDGVRRLQVKVRGFRVGLGAEIAVVAVCKGVVKLTGANRSWFGSYDEAKVSLMFGYDVDVIILHLPPRFDVEA